MNLSLFPKLRWALPFLGAFLPIALLSVYSYQTASQSVQNLVESGNIAATNNLFQLVTQDFSRTISLANAIASVPGTVTAVERRDDLAVLTRLKAVVLSHPQLDRAFVIDRDGILWSDYPPSPGELGKNEAGTEWYRGLSARWKPYISRVYLRPIESRYPVVAIATPIVDAEDHAIGAVVFEYSLGQITKWVQNISLSNGGYLYIVDNDGTLIAHPDLKPAEPLHREYADLPVIQDALKGKILGATYEDPLAHEEVLATFLPISVGRNQWLVVAQQPVSQAFASLHDVKVRISLAGALLTLMTLAMILGLAHVSARNERLNQQLKDFASIVSHQLKAPITAMQWTIELLFDGSYGDVPEKLKEPLLQMKDTTRRNKQLITDILNMSRIDRGVVSLELETMPLQDVVELAVRDYRHAIEQQGLKLILDGMDRQITILADKEKLAEAIGNSVSNAIKHTPTGSIAVRLRTEGDYAFIDVSDTGKGIPPEILRKLFTRDQIMSGSASPESSAGLGLFIAKRFMTMQHGDITVQSALGKGTTFTYRIPLAKDGNGAQPHGQKTDS
jgi:signal transduction histidine kinase